MKTKDTVQATASNNQKSTKAKYSFDRHFGRLVSKLRNCCKSDMRFVRGEIDSGLAQKFNRDAKRVAAAYGLKLWQAKAAMLRAGSYCLDRLAQESAMQKLETSR